mgnify:CR=1 FL=1
MKRNTLVLFSLFASISVSAQEVVSTQGDSYSNGSGSIDFTLGEVIIATGTDGTNDLTQGFHQTNWNFLGVEDHLPSYAADIFPNPTDDILNIRTSVYEGVTYTVYDLQGKLLLQNKLFSEQTSIQLGQFSAGTYSLVLNNDTQKLKTFGLVKTH